MKNIFSVSGVTSLIKNKLENEIPSMYVEGEISEYKHHASGHRYFTIKDNNSNLNCIIWRFMAQKLTFTPKVGMNVVLFGKLNVYVPQGKYSFIVSSINEKGVGALYQKYEELKNRLKNEGMFDSEKKKPIPKYPINIGIITSDSGSALQDILQNFKRNAPHINLFLYPAKMQGEGGAETVISGIEEFEKEENIDLLIISRGGGSIEDLWEFNRENLARAVFNSTIPIISGVGHETDTTIIDFVSDYRCTTPTNSAEYAMRYWQDMDVKINNIENQLVQNVDRIVHLANSRFNELINSYGFKRPIDIFEKWNEYLDDYTDKLNKIILEKVDRNSLKLSNIDKQLSAYSPNNVIKKGYSIVYNKNGKVIKSIKSVEKNDDIEIKICDGFIDSKVNKTRAN